MNRWYCSLLLAAATIASSLAAPDPLSLPEIEKAARLLRENGYLHQHSKVLKLALNDKAADGRRGVIAITTDHKAGRTYQLILDLTASKIEAKPIAGE